MQLAVGDAWDKAAAASAKAWDAAAAMDNDGK